MPGEQEITPRIQKLSPVLVDQIAAGEVVERPASVLKELIENALDAGATSIHVELEGGGLDEIVVADNGCGMAPADLLLCVEQHATSKIHSLSDLAAIHTFGFRGEAVSSIASVSDLEIQSRLRGHTRGFKIPVHFGVKPLRPEPCAAAEGTRFQVRHLFEKIPARRKFLRSAGTELSHCTRLVKELAMGNPDVRFSLSHQGRRLFEFVPTTRAKRVREATRWGWNPIEVADEADGLRLNALLWDPQQNPGKNEWYLFVNRRPVRNRNLYGLIKGLFPDPGAPSAGVLYLDIRHDWLDVNVHPQKWEIRFWQQERLFPWVRSTLRKALATPPARSEIKAASGIPTPCTSPPMSGSVVGTLQSGYILAEKNGSVFLIHSASLQWQRTFESLTSQFREAEVPRRACGPLVFSVAANEALFSALESKHESLLHCGFEIERYGISDLCLKQCPRILTDAQAINAAKAIFENATHRDIPSRWLRLVAKAVPTTALSNSHAASLVGDPSVLSKTTEEGHVLVFELNSETIAQYFERPKN
ncbi:MAG: DNA mismatch repair endonuclease MutL [Bdellovibrionales bacterium]|nr:DNA mismatch repair endonuclease MutL [Bdellovibrionales bacterium]